MSDDELLAIYRKAWDLYYSPEHVERVIRRAKAWGYDPRNMMMKLLTFHAVPRIENVHPLEGGLFRRKYRRDRRPGMPRENPFVFYPRYAWQVAKTQLGLVAMYWQHVRILKRVLRDTDPYEDIAMAPVQENDFDALELFNATQAAKTVVEKQRRKTAAATSVVSSGNAHVFDDVETGILTR